MCSASVPVCARFSICVSLSKAVAESNLCIIQYLFDFPPFYLNMGLSTACTSCSSRRTSYDYDLHLNWEAVDPIIQASSWTCYWQLFVHGWPFRVRWRCYFKYKCNEIHDAELDSESVRPWPCSLPSVYDVDSGYLLCYLTRLFDDPHWRTDYDLLRIHSFSFKKTNHYFDNFCWPSSQLNRVLKLVYVNKTHLPFQSVEKMPSVTPDVHSPSTEAPVLASLLLQVKFYHQA